MTASKTLASFLLTALLLQAQAQEPGSADDVPVPETEASPAESDAGRPVDEDTAAVEALPAAVADEETTQGDETVAAEAAPAQNELEGKDGGAASDEPRPEPEDALAPDAEPAIADVEEPGPPEPNLVDTRARFDGFVELGEFSAAVETGRELIEQTKIEMGAESDATADAMTLVGRAATQAEDYDYAEALFLDAIALYESNNGTLAPILIDPLTGLGDNYQASDAHPEAISAYVEARSLSRRNFGLLNKDQIVLLDEMSESYLELEQLETADELQLNALRIAERVDGFENPAVLPALYKYGGWLRSIGRFADERLLYLRAMDIIKRTYGKDHPLSAVPLRETGNSFRVERIAEGLGASSLKRSIAVLENAEEPDALELARSYRDLGDWYTAFSRTGKGAAEYRTAWRLLDQVEDGDEYRRTWFRSGRFVFYTPPAQRGLRAKGSEPGLKDGFVTVRFDLTARGRPTNIELVDSDPKDFKEESVKRALRRSRLRPILADDGNPVLAEGLVRRYEYIYKPSS